jgi:hypothetical protein
MTNNKQQTAVEWQYIELSKFLNGKSEFTHKSDILIKAKEIEKEQKRKDFVDGYAHGDSPLNHSVIDKWYEKTYGGGEQ